MNVSISNEEQYMFFLIHYKYTNVILCDISIKETITKITKEVKVQTLHPTLENLILHHFNETIASHANLDYIFIRLG